MSLVTPSDWAWKLVSTRCRRTGCAKARALTNGRYHVSYDDIRALAHPVMRHRVLTNFHAQSEGITSDTLIDRLLEAVPVPRSGM